MGGKEMKLKDLIEQYGEYEVSETKGDWCDANHVTLELKKPKPKTVWDLKNDDEYYYINADGYVNLSMYAEIESEENGVSVGNTFLTEEEAEKDVERRKVETLLLKYGGRRWFKEDLLNYYLVLSENSENLAVDWLKHGPSQGLIYFDLKEQAQKAIEQIGEERIKKALFEVR